MGHLVPKEEVVATIIDLAQELEKRAEDPDAAKISARLRSMAANLRLRDSVPQQADRASLDDWARAWEILKETTKDEKLESLGEVKARRLTCQQLAEAASQMGAIALRGDVGRVIPALHAWANDRRSKHETAAADTADREVRQLLTSK